jgi:hypothetical protein
MTDKLMCPTLPGSECMKLRCAWYSIQAYQDGIGQCAILILGESLQYVKEFGIAIDKRED